MPWQQGARDTLQSHAQGVEEMGYFFSSSPPSLAKDWAGERAH